MSIKAIKWALSLPKEKVRANEKFVLTILGEHANKDHCCWPSTEVLQQECGLSRASIHHHLAQLEKKQFIVRKPLRDNQGYRRGTHYYLNMSAPVQEEAVDMDVPGMDTVEEGASQILPPDKNIEAVFTYWQQVMERPQAKLDKHRHRIIKQALSLYDVESLQKAINGCARSAYHMGANDQQRCFNGIDSIFRHADRIEHFIHMAQTPIRPLQRQEQWPEIFKGGF